jgi:predicted methyltransferase
MRTALLLSLFGWACAAQPPPTAPPPDSTAGAIDYAALVAAPDRSEADRQLDAGRKPAELLAFAEIGPGMVVAELAAGGGYTAELLMRAVGPTGVVYGQNNPFILERFAAGPWAERLAKPINSKILRADREFDDPLPPEAQGLDRVLLILFYHDTVWMKTDRARMNAAIFRALKPGGLYVIVDHSGRAGTGVSEAETLHRIEEQVVREEVTAAGFVLAGEGDFLREPKDARDWNASPRQAGERRGTSDRFVLKFKKP